jgi:hypothetical protein
MYRIADLWTARSMRERLLAVVGVLAVLVAMFLAFGRGSPDAVAPAVTTPAAAIDHNPDGTSGSTRLAPGTVRATAPTPAAPAPSGGGAAPSAPASSAAPATDDTARNEQIDAAMNRTWSPVPTQHGPTRVDSPAEVVAAGRALEQVASNFNSCAATQTDHYLCLGVVKDPIVLERVFDNGSKGLAISLVAGQHVVRLVFRGTEMCRMLDAETGSCQAWSTS